MSVDREGDCNYMVMLVSLLLPCARVARMPTDHLGAIVRNFWFLWILGLVM